MALFQDLNNNSDGSDLKGRLGVDIISKPPSILDGCYVDLNPQDK